MATVGAVQKEAAGKEFNIDESWHISVFRLHECLTVHLHLEQ
jgi:hypothetical protein